MVRISGKNSKPLWCTLSEKVTKITPPSTPSSNDEGLRDIGYIMNIENLILGANTIMVSHLIHYDSLLQNATNIIRKCDRSLLQNLSGFLLQNATVITKCDVYYKLRQYTVKIYIKNLQILVTEMFNVKNAIAPKIISDIFKVSRTTYNLRNKIAFVSNHVKTVYFSTESLSYSGPKFWDLLPSIDVTNADQISSKKMVSTKLPLPNLQGIYSFVPNFRRGESNCKFWEKKPAHLIIMRE